MLAKRVRKKIHHWGKLDPGAKIPLEKTKNPPQNAKVSRRVRRLGKGG
jgi:hypothetical protein